jgi:hypothetical protein
MPYMDAKAEIKITGVALKEKLLWKSRCALLGESLSEYLLTNIRTGELERQRIERKAAKDGK